MENKRFFKWMMMPALAIVIVSCGNKGEEDLVIPEGILSKEEYVKVLTDLSLAESAANLNVKNLRPEKMDSAYAFDPLSENKISRGKYDSTALFYSTHPQEYKEIYEEVLKRLSEMESKRKGSVKDTIQTEKK